jgi:hypothetical protein
MKLLKQYQLAHTSSKHYVKNHYMSVNCSLTASQQYEKISCLKIFITYYCTSVVDAFG